jgi:hypothetical protein
VELDAMPKTATPRGGDAPVRRFAYQLKTGFSLLHISDSYGAELVAAGIIRVVDFGGRSRRITHEEIERLLTEGIPPAPQCPACGKRKWHHVCSAAPRARIRTRTRATTKTAQRASAD